MSTEERRKYKRVKGDVALSINDTVNNLITESLDISVSGVSCKVSKKIPLMSKVVITLLLPRSGAKGKKAMNKVICEGVVVRIESIKDEPSHYLVGIFFKGIDKQEEKALEKYVSYVESQE
jgi:c-di-GMP-binding flagellar brake protein YcgR